MTKLDYRKMPTCDPARVIDVRESGVWSGDDRRRFETEAQRRKRRAKERAATIARLEKMRYDAIIKKFGIVHAANYGVPQEIIAAKMLARARARAQRAQERAQQKRNCDTTSKLASK